MQQIAEAKEICWDGLQIDLQLVHEGGWLCHADSDVEQDINQAQCVWFVHGKHYYEKCGWYSSFHNIVCLDLPGNNWD